MKVTRPALTLCNTASPRLFIGRDPFDGKDGVDEVSKRFAPHVDETRMNYFWLSALTVARENF
ncbi:MAG: hypothetical protein U0V48_03560 [Anaerolineales bacterium]